MTESPFMDSGFAVPVFSPGDDPIACLNKAMDFLTTVASSRFPATNNQLRTSSNLRNQFTIPDAGLQCNKFRGDKGKIILTEDLDTYDSDCDDLSTTKAVLMANISIYGSNVISEATVQDTNLQAQQDSMILSVIEQMSEKMINHVNNIIRKRLIGNRILNQTTAELERYKDKAQRIKPTLYDGVVISNTHVAMPVIDDEETLILKEEIRSKMSEKLTEDFGKCFTLQQELLAEQAFWFHIINPTIEPSYTPPVIIDVPSELPKVSLVNASLKKLKFHLAQFDYVVKKRTTPNAHEEGEWGFKHTKSVFNNEIIPFLKSLKDIFSVFDKDLLNEITEVQTVFDQMEAAVQQSSVDKQCLEIVKKELLLENDRLLQNIMSQDILLNVMDSMSLNNDYVNMEMQKCESCEKCLNLDAEFSK
ncbi:hypothetical protein Tco_0961378 [Tanacetum coccineum]